MMKKKKNQAFCPNPKKIPTQMRLRPTQQKTCCLDSSFLRPSYFAIVRFSRRQLLAPALQKWSTNCSINAVIIPCSFFSASWVCYIYMTRFHRTILPYFLFLFIYKRKKGKHQSHCWVLTMKEKDKSRRHKQNLRSWNLMGGL